MATDRLDSGRCALLDIIYNRQTQDRDPLALMPAWFEGLRRLLPFSSGVFMPIDPVGGALCQGYTHDCNQQDMRDYLDNYQTLDPYVIWQPALKKPDTVVRLSDVTDIGTTFRGEFGEFMNRIPYFHALAVIPQLNGIPVGAFSVHRRRRQRDFDPREMALFQWFVGHAATAIDYLTLQHQRDQQRPLAVLVMSRDGSIQALSAEAMRILESLPDKVVQLLPGPTESSRIWRCGSEVFAVSTRRIDPASIVGLGHVSRVPPSPAIDRLARRLRITEGEQRRRFAVTFEKLDVNNEVRGEIFGLQLTPQQKRVAILLLKRYEPRQIADILMLSPHTVREYVKDIYRRAGVSGYEKLISRLSSATRVNPQADQPDAWRPRPNGDGLPQPPDPGPGDRS
ncbi:helix-turn-helix transcriptional regulator [Accumulibacter sp.]|uniref:helix-turn-helix transcriptional regulator n=1 Tax=Accumulibacter sp. TaxID=2053492 RepID=UPI0026083D5E|nr:helix-turn-helix transcriptional regulator [Accumulibacter sp.]